MNSFIRLTVVFAITALCVQSARASLIIGTIAFPRGGEYALVGGATGSGIAGWVTAAIPEATFVGTQTLDPSFLSTVDILIIDAATDYGLYTTLSPAEQDAVLNFVKSGKGAIIVADTLGYIGGASFANPFGVSAGGSTSNSTYIVNTTLPIGSGPYGTASTPFTVDFVGIPSGFASLGPYAQAIAVSSSGDTTIAAIRENVLAPGSGRVVLFSDAGTVLETFIRGNGVFLNSIAYVSVPESSSLILAAVAMSGGFVARRFSTSRKRPGK